MNTERLAFVRGWADTRATLAAWQEAPVRPVLRWTAGASITALLLLSATLTVALMSRPDFSPVLFPGINVEQSLGEYGLVLKNNGLVLLLHAMACVGGFIAGSSLPHAAEGYSGVWRRAHDLAGPAAIAFVAAATLFSLGTQAYVLGGAARTLAWQLDVSSVALVAAISVHAVPELIALFLPLAAWTIAARRGAWHELLAATFVTIAIAIPVLLAAAAVEVWVTPHVLVAISG